MQLSYMNTTSFPMCDNPSIGNLSITLKGVQKLLEKINISKAAGPDLIPGRMLNMLAPELAPIVHAIFTQSLDTGELPRDRSLANVAPIFKKATEFWLKTKDQSL